MAIISTDFVVRLSGGAGNGVADLSLGGVRSSALAQQTIDALFDTVTQEEATAGDTEYRCVYVCNDNATDTMQNASVFVATNTPLATTTIQIGVGTAAVNGTEQTVANENTAPSGVTFSAPSALASALVLGNIPAGQHKALWIKRVVDAGAATAEEDGATLTLMCEQN